jgi:hypothetical protein
MREILAHWAEIRKNETKKGGKQGVLQICDFWHQDCLKICKSSKHWEEMVTVRAS